MVCPSILLCQSPSVLGASGGPSMLAHAALICYTEGGARGPWATAREGGGGQGSQPEHITYTLTNAARPPFKSALSLCGKPTSET